jgi:phosphoribosyl 1,2-cyclic phosphodiesterase
MKIKCYGSRGSLPVSGKEYLKYGGDTTCILVTAKTGEIVIIDAGSGIRKLGNEILQQDNHDVNVIFTHAHWDHLIGFPFFKPLYLKKFNINVYGCPFTHTDSIKNLIAGTMQIPHFPVDLSAINANLKFIDVKYSQFEIGSLKIVPIFLSHPNGGVGYKITEDGKSFVFLTDNELGYCHENGLNFVDYVRDCGNVEILFHDGEYTPEEYKKRKTWGHSSYEDATRLAIESNVEQLGIFHHNQDRLDDEVDDIILKCQAQIDASGSDIDCYGVYQGLEITL